MDWSMVALILGIMAILFVGLPLAMAEYEKSKKTSIFQQKEDR